MSENGKAEQVKEATISQKFEAIYSNARLAGFVSKEARKMYNEVADFIEQHEKVENKE